MIKRVSAVALLFMVAVLMGAAPQVIWNSVGVCDWNAPQHCLVPQSNGSLNVNLNAGTAVIGKVGIDQTTPGTTNAVSPQGANGIIGITPTDRTITSATGASQTVMNANAARHSLTIVNTGNANCGVNPTGGTAAIGGAGTLTLVPNGSYTPRVPTLSAVTAICTAAQPLYADEN